MFKKYDLQYILLRSFLIIAAILIVLMLPIVYMLSKNVYEQNIQEKSYIADINADMIENAVSSSIRQIYFVFDSDGFKKTDFLNIESKSNFYNVNQLSDMLKSIELNTESISNMAVYIKQENYFICTNGVLRPEEYYSVFWADFNSYDEWYDTFINNSKLIAHSDRDTSNKRMYYKLDIYDNAKSNSYISIIAEIDPVILENAVKGLTDNGDCGVCMRFTNCNQWLFSENIKDRDMIRNGSFPGKYYVLSNSMSSVGLDYYVLCEKTHMRIAVGIVWAFFIILCVLIIVIVLMYIRILKRKVFKGLFDLFELSGYKEYKKGRLDVDEFQFLRYYIEYLQDSMKAQNKKELFLALVSGFASETRLQYKKQLMYDKYMMLVIRPAMYDMRGTNSEKYTQDEIRFIFLNVFDELFEKDYIVESEQIDNDCCFLLNSEEFDRKRLLYSIKTGQDFLKQHFKIELNVGIGAVTDSLSNVLYSYYQAIDAMTLCDKTERIAFYDDILQEKNQNVSELIKSNIEYGNAEQVFFVVNNYIETMLANKAYNGVTKMHLIELLKTVFVGFEPYYMVDEFKLTKYVLDSKNKEELMDNIKKLIDEMFADDNTCKKDNREVRIKRYIDDNYMDINLTVASIADEFNMNSVYLERVFKTMFNETISSYIFNVRLAKAKELLVETDEKISEIAAKVGYSNQSFSRAFKKQMGCSPSEYREKYRR